MELPGYLIILEVWYKKEEGEVVCGSCFLSKERLGNYTPLCIPPKSSFGIRKFAGTAVNPKAF